jgi:hypothetical protein
VSKNTNIYRYHADPESLDLFREVTAKNPEFAYICALALGRRFPGGEAAIAKDAEYAFFYAIGVIKGRWPEGEAAIAKNAKYALGYAREVIKERFPEGEAALAKDAKYAYLYARDVIEGRFPEGEAAIAKNRFVKPVYEKLFNVKLS